MAGRRLGQRVVTAPRRLAAAMLLLLSWALCGAVPPPGSGSTRPPGLPSSFWGAVTVDLQPVVGAVVTALIDGTVVARAETYDYGGAAMYTLHVPEDDPASTAVEGGSAGDLIAFAVDGARTAQSIAWGAGENARVDLAGVTVRFEGPEWAVDEGAGQATVTLRLGAPQKQEAHVSYCTRPGSAGETDYGPVRGEAIVAKGLLTATIALTLQDDTLDEPDESFWITLDAAEGALLGAPLEAQITIRDDDPPPVARLERAHYTVSEDAGSVSLRVLLSTPSGKVVRVGWSATDGSATSGADYVPSTSSVTFGPGETAKPLTVLLIHDEAPESPETFAVQLLSATNAVLAEPSHATVTIFEAASLYVPLLRAP